MTLETECPERRCGKSVAGVAGILCRIPRTYSPEWAAGQAHSVSNCHPELHNSDQRRKRLPGLHHDGRTMTGRKHNSLSEPRNILGRPIFIGAGHSPRKSRTWKRSKEFDLFLTAADHQNSSGCSSLLGATQLCYYPRNLKLRRGLHVSNC